MHVKPLGKGRYCNHGCARRVWSDGRVVRHRLFRLLQVVRAHKKVEARMAVAAKEAKRRVSDAADARRSDSTAVKKRKVNAAHQPKASKPVKQPGSMDHVGKPDKKLQGPAGAVHVPRTRPYNQLHGCPAVCMDYVCKLCVCTSRQAGAGSSSAAERSDQSHKNAIRLRRRGDSSVVGFAQEAGKAKRHLRACRHKVRSASCQHWSSVAA